MVASRIAQVVRSIQLGLRWLKVYADNLTDSRSVAITISALVAAERNPHSHVIQRLTHLLLRQQGSNGSWGDELWDTTWAVSALQAVGQRYRDPSVAAAFRFFRATQDSIRGSWYEEPFETMLVLDLFASMAPDVIPEVGNRALEWLCSLQNEDGSVIGVRYTGMAASLLKVVPGERSDLYLHRSQRAIEWLRSDIEFREIWTAAAWSNFYPLKALLEHGYTIDDPVVDKVVAWFLAAQDEDGKWMQVARVYDTAMSIIVLSRLLTTPLVDIQVPRSAVISANQENGTLRVSFQGPGTGAITPTDRLKVSEAVRAELGRNQHSVLMRATQFRSRSWNTQATTVSVAEDLITVGRYAFGYLIPPRIQGLLEGSTADHLRLDVDERLIDLPWELVHDGTEFICLRYAMGRRLLSDQVLTLANRSPQTSAQTKVLIVSNPTGDLPAADEEGVRVERLLRTLSSMQVDHRNRDSIGKKEFLLSVHEYDIVHYAGHASHDPGSPDESVLVFADGEISAFEIARFITHRSPAVVFLNACWSAEELRNVDSYPAMMRGLGRTFLFAGVTAFLGYLIPVPDESATRLATEFYSHLVRGQTIGESLRQARIETKNLSDAEDVTWSSAILYGDPTARAIALRAE